MVTVSGLNVMPIGLKALVKGLITRAINLQNRGLKVMIVDNLGNKFVGTLNRLVRINTYINIEQVLMTLWEKYLKKKLLH